MIYQGQPGTSEAALTLRPFGATAVPSNTKVILKQIILANTSSSSATVSISLVPSGGTAGAANRIVPNVSVSANSVVVIDLSQVMEPGDFLSAVQGTAGAITVNISGVVVS
jgi:hypothetical protein